MINKHTLEEVCEVAGKELVEELAKVIQKDYIPVWFYLTNPAFENKSPYEICKDGQKDRLERMIYDLSSGDAF
jgi:hypothetical protein